MSAVVIVGATVALELIRFVRVRKDLEGKTAEEVLAVWAETSERAKVAYAAWQAAGAADQG